jgi:hypothetical protein
MDVSLFGTCSHVIIMTQKVDPRAEGGTRIFINESSIKVIGMCRDVSSFRESSSTVGIAITRKLPEN